MALAVLFELPQSRQHWDTWAFVNMAHHRDINRVLFETTGTRINESVLDPFDIDQPDSWLTKHQVMHQEQNAALGIQGFDLQNVDFEDKEAMEAWITAHANEHYQAAQILGIG